MTEGRLDTELRVGIVGAGKVAHVHAAALARIPGAHLVAVAGRSPERTAALAGAYGARADRGITELLDRGGVDAVILCTPHPQHPEQGIAAARAGLHVLVEKPMALTTADDAGSIFVAGVTPPSVARNDLWTIPGEESLPEQWYEEDRARAEHVDLESHYHELQLRDFVDSIRNGRPPAVTAEDGLATAQLIDGIYTAMRTGGRVRLGDRA